MDPESEKVSFEYTFCHHHHSHPHLGQVYGLGSQGRQPLPPVPVGLRVGGWSSSSSLGPNSVLEIHPKTLHPSSF